MFRFPILLSVIAILASVECQRMTGVVQTAEGPVRGRIFETIWHSKPYSSFQGIPYGKPPVGSLRFKDPIKADPWTEVLNATETTKFCPQYEFANYLGQEDCLYINVYTPVVNFDNVTKDNPKKAVMFWIYGGGFVGGAALQGVYAPDFFLEDDVVFVSFNYRLDVLGFLALDIPGVEGNAGAKDQILALKWVQRNIAAFGGDPNRVTIFGESAGGASVDFHLLSSQAEGLFHQIIIQSASVLCPWAYNTRDKIKANAFALAASLGFHTTDQQELLDFLQRANLDDLLSSARGQLIEIFPITIGTYVPTLSDDFMDDCPVKKMRNGNFSRVPIMMGYTKEEFDLFADFLDITGVTINKLVEKITNLALVNMGNLVENQLGKLGKLSEDELIKFGTAFLFTASIDLSQKYFAKYSDQPIYYYRLSYKSKYNLHMLLDNKVNGTGHSDDLDLLFNIRVLLPTDPLDPFNQYRKKFVSLWTNFAKYGNPTPNDEPINGAVWKPSGTDGAQLNIDVQNTMHPARLLSENDQLLGKAMEAQLLVSSNCKPDNPISSISNTVKNSTHVV